MYLNIYKWTIKKLWYTHWDTTQLLKDKIMPFAKICMKPEVVML